MISLRMLGPRTNLKRDTRAEFAARFRTAARPLTGSPALKRKLLIAIPSASLTLALVFYAVHFASRPASDAPSELNASLSQSTASTEDETENETSPPSVQATT